MARRELAAAPAAGGAGADVAGARRGTRNLRQECARRTERRDRPGRRGSSPTRARGARC